ncbi:MAG: 50S ribosomal protein L35ae [Candidatus Woesearchaeota archaeon]|nr:50S ribosomal protein L35ae [Candidatus Woesearchaeota archaeon]
MEGTISNYRGSRRVKKGNHMIIVVEGIDNKEKAASLVGKKVVYKTEGKKGNEIIGKVAAAHGNSGAIRAIFETGMPGQAIGKKVLIE